MNRWYHAASWAAKLFCGPGGALIIGAAVVWGMTGPTLGRVLVVLNGLQLIGMIVVLVAFFVVGGLLVIGHIAQGNKETREWARSLDQANDAAGFGPAKEDHPPQ